MSAIANPTPRTDWPLLLAAAGLVAVALALWQKLPALESVPALDLRQQALEHRLELENRLRLADRVLRAIAADIVAKGQDSAPLGEAERRYFDSVTFSRAGQAPIQLLTTTGTAPDLNAALRRQLVLGDSVVVAQLAEGQHTARVSLVRELAPAGATPALLTAVLSPPYLWPTASDAELGLCVQLENGLALHCSDPQTWLASTALGKAKASSDDRVTWVAGTQDWHGAGARLTLASPYIAEPWTVLAMAQPATAAAVSAWSRPIGLALTGAALLGAVAALVLLRRRRRVNPSGKPGPAPKVGGQLVDISSEKTFGESALQHRLDRQRHAIRAMADIDRASLSRASVERLVELATGHLLLCTGAEAATIAVLESDGLNRMTVALSLASDVDPPAPEQRSVDPSLGSLLSAPTDGGWIHKLDELPLLFPLAHHGAKNAFVLPIHQDGQPCGIIALACRDSELIGGDETSNARAIAGRLGTALTSLAREQALYSQTHFDATTTLPNRQYLKEHLPQQISRARRDRVRLALLFVDLDGFKKVNRSAGHSRGDLVLAQAASRMRACVREEDLVARFGGDEFVVVLPKVAAGMDARRVADKLLVALARPYLIDGEEYQLGCSIGISIFPDDAQTVDMMLRNSDSAMFDAKAAGRGRYAFFDATVNRAAIDRSGLELELHRAVTNSEFVVYFQPQIDLRSGQIDGVEALVRWNHPTRGLVGPYDFITVAEQSGLIDQLGEQVMLAACKQFREWDAKGIAPQRISVNVSSLEVTRGDIVGRIDRILNDTGLRPMHLELELTEGVFLEEAGGALEKLHLLRQRGVRIAIDDFGTGYSSLSYLRRLPIDVVKIDQSFVRDLTSNHDSSSIVRAVIEVARNLGKLVVAEGVELEQQSTELQRLGCDVGQGYLWSHPLPAAQFESFLRHWQLVSRPVPLEAI